MRAPEPEGEKIADETLAAKRERMARLHAGRAGGALDGALDPKILDTEPASDGGEALGVNEVTSAGVGLPGDLQG
jgi:hypothetical protein